MTAQPGAPLAERLRGFGRLVPPIVAGGSADRLRHGDPLVAARRRLGPTTAAGIETQAREEITAAVHEALHRAEVAR